MNELKSLYHWTKLYKTSQGVLSTVVARHGIPPESQIPGHSPTGYVKLYSYEYLNEKLAALGISMIDASMIVEAELATAIDVKRDVLKQLEAAIFKAQFKLQELEMSLSRKTKALMGIRASMDELFDADEILLQAGAFRRVCGIYFLIQEDEIVYVGQSVTVHNRINQHVGVKEFDRFTYIRCKPEELDVLETKYILKFKPKYNFDSNGKLVTPTSKGVVFDNADL
jgi:hypothetical protein